MLELSWTSEEGHERKCLRTAEPTHIDCYFDQNTMKAMLTLQ